VVRSFRRGAFAAVVVLSLASLAACAAGNSAETSNVRPDTASATVGDIKVQNAFVLTRPSGPAAVSARLFNNGATEQTLESLQVAGGISATLTGKDGGRAITVPAHGSVLLGGKGNPTAAIETGGESLRDGDVQKAVFVFSSTGPVALQINVTPATGEYADFGPSSLPTTAPPAPTGTAAPTDTATATATATQTQTVTPTGTATAQ
jgi:hypothetical protein